MKRELRIFFIALMAFLLIASVTIRFFDVRAERQESVLSLREVVPPAGTVQFVAEGAPFARYLRTAIAIEYDGHDWLLQEIGEVKIRLQESQEGKAIFTPDTGYLSRSYHDFSRDALNRISTINDPRYLELPEGISDRVKDLSQRITEGMPTPFEKAKAIETFLRVRYTYKMDYAPPPPGREPNDWFLFESREGVCGNFTSAFVVLARASGLPARMAAGYYLSPTQQKYQPVYAGEAHAWAEVAFTEFGWLAFEAVPP